MREQLDHAGHRGALGGVVAVAVVAVALAVAPGAALLALLPATAATTAVAAAAGAARARRALVLVGGVGLRAVVVGDRDGGRARVGVVARVGVAGPAAAAAAAGTRLGRVLVGGALLEDLLLRRAAGLRFQDGLDEVGLAELAVALEAQLGREDVQVGERRGLQGGAGQDGHGWCLSVRSFGGRPAALVSGRRASGSRA